MTHGSYGRFRLLSIAFLVAGLLATGFAFWQSRKLVEHDLVAQLNLQVADVQGRIEQQLREYQLILGGYRAHFVLRNGHSHETFREVTQTLELAQRLSGFQAIGYSMRAVSGDLPTLEAALGEDYAVARAFSRHGGAPEAASDHYIVRYIEPLGANLNALGFDQATDPGLASAIRHARDSGQLAVVSPAGDVLASGGDDRLVFFMPLYWGGGASAPQTLQERRDAFTGVVFLMVRAREMFHAMLEQERLAQLAVDVAHIAPGESLPVAPLLYDSRLRAAGSLSGAALRQDERLTRTLMLPVADAVWRVTVAPDAAYGTRLQSWIPTTYVVIGILSSLLLFFSIQRLGRAGEESEVRAMQVEQSLHSTERQLADIMASINEVLWTLRVPGKIVSYVSPAVQQIYGRPPEAFVQNPRLWNDSIHPEDRKRMERFLSSLQGGQPAMVHCRIVRPDGAERWLRYTARLTQAAPDGPGRIDCVGSDVTEEYLLEESLRLRQRAIEASANAIVISSVLRPGYPVEYVNPAFERMTGYTSEEIRSKGLRLLHRQDTDQPGLRALRILLRERREGSAVMRNYRKDGSLFWSQVYLAPVRNDDGEVTHFVAAKYDITETKSYQERLEFQATHDALTGLANRTLLRERLALAMEKVDAQSELLWVVFLDLDHFKFINDTLGHDAGDILLQQIARRLQQVLRPQDTLARQGGDEFVLVLRQLSPEDANEQILERIMSVVQQPLKVDGHSFYPSCSIGVSVYPNDGKHPETLIKHADVAMYRAKEMGRNNIQFFTAELNARAMERLRLESDLRQALSADQFVLHYQPQASLTTGAVTGAEALVRWQHPRFGLMPPGQFIRLAEETGLIVPIGLWVMRSACRQVKAWEDMGLGRLQISVNLSARQFSDSDLVGTIDEVLRDTGLDAAQLELELTETMLMTDVDYSRATLRQLKSRGVKVQIDDFGTGYSSMAYLKQFPLDVLKIDRSFVHDIHSSVADAAIVQSVIALAHGLGLGVIAEGVETQEQLAYLQAKGCDQIQGYYFSKPLPAADMEAMLRAGTRLPMCQSISLGRQAEVERGNIQPAP